MVDGAWTSSSREQLIVSSDQPSRLLRVPCEVRARILRELLCHDKPLRSSVAKERRLVEPKPLFKLHISILRTCHQLYDEGLPILRRKNAFNIDILLGERSARVILLGLDLNATNAPHYLTERRYMLLRSCRDLYLTIDFQRKNIVGISEHRSGDYRSRLHEAMKLLLNKFPQLPPNVTISVPGRRKYLANNQLGEIEPLSALAMYRPTGSLKFEGVSPDIEQHFRLRMQQDPPMPDIYQLRRSLERYCRATLHDQHPAVAALERFDIPLFIGERELLVKEHDAMIEEKRLTMYQQDLSAWNPEKDEMKGLESN